MSNYLLFNTKLFTHIIITLTGGEVFDPEDLEVVRFGVVWKNIGGMLKVCLWLPGSGAERIPQPLNDKFIFVATPMVLKYTFDLKFRHTRVPVCWRSGWWSAIVRSKKRNVEH